MRIGDDTSVTRVERFFLGDVISGKPFPFDARVRSQMLAVGLLFVCVPIGFRVVAAAASSLSFGWQAVVSTVVGGGGGAVFAIMVTRVYGRYDTPQTRLDYWLWQAWSLATAPKPYGPPVEHVDALAPAPGPRRLPGRHHTAPAAPETVHDRTARLRGHN